MPIILYLVSIPIRDLMNLNLEWTYGKADAMHFVSIPIRDLMNLNPYNYKNRAVLIRIVSIPIRDLMNLNPAIVAIHYIYAVFQSLLGI